ncbi:bifunctional diguanylate cyclase/phosphodiesterase [Phenylobacterium sp.]|uniref:putative bifunctional diguanylate cyclase/phosphodiesterase n=1 Tax=Phenylobacterium sp. TaxID=1871053 RepID=UPI0027311AA4|nr:EAL domain-containing protein [Phenylobacterium sp.]MDP1874295.1 EAL domain-containing protein [Phenylobacterium sp.]
MKGLQIRQIPVRLRGLWRAAHGPHRGFSRLRTRLAVLYAGLFGLILALVAVAVFAATSASAQRQVRAELEASGTVFDRIWSLRSDQLRQGASLLARDFGFRAAVATEDTATVVSAMENLRSRLELDEAFILTADGRLLGDESAALGDRASGLLDALYADENAAGVLVVGDQPYQMVAAPILAPDLRGWVVFAARLDAAQMRQLEALAAIPLTAAVRRQTAGTWRGEAGDLSPSEIAGIAATLQDQERSVRVMRTEGVRSLAVVKTLPPLIPGDRTVLVLSYPLRLALAPYHALMAWLAALGLAGLAIMAGGSWMLASSLARPIADLDLAAQRLSRGEEAHVDVAGDDEIGRLASSFNTMADEIRERERRILHMAMHDSETGLPNRLALEQALDRTSARDTYVAVVGVERFAQVRSAIGYRLAGLMVQKIGERLQGAAPEGHAARVSSEALGLVLRSRDAEAALAEAHQLLEALQSPVSVEGEAIDVDLTIGLAPRLEDQTSAFAVDRANIALDQARVARVKVAAFDGLAYGDPSASLALMSRMLGAIESGHMLLHHQPKFDLRAGQVNAVESLIRWRREDGSLIRPDLFIPMAEETGHIRALTDWVINQAIEDQGVLLDQGHDLAFSVNVSGRLLGDSDFADFALAAAAKARGRLCFEITETAVIENPDLALKIIDRFAEAGIEISIDDFGSGLSSLAYLKQIRGHELKIDRALISGLADSRRDALIVRSTIDLAHGLGMKVVAEGVETEAVFALLGALGCDSAQGYLIARPMTLEALGAFLADDALRTRQSA